MIPAPDSTVTCPHCGVTVSGWLDADGWRTVRKARGADGSWNGYAFGPTYGGCVAMPDALPPQNDRPPRP
jgi:hypothetical protein